MRLFNFLCCLLISSSCIAETKEVAITIDDLPLVGSSMNTPGNQQRSTERFHRIVQALVDNKVPATGFIIAGAIAKGQWEFLEEFRNAGFMLGNHTYSHYNLNSMNADKYIADLDKADKKLEPIMTEPKYFRYPYLAMGNKNSKPKVLAYLQEHHYTIAPVTIDSKDFQFNEQLYRVPYRMRESYVNKLKPRYLAYIWKQTLRAEKQAEGKPVKQILLIHANLLNSYALPDIIKMYRDNGYQFISLTDALKNPANQLNYGTEEKDNSDDELEKELMPFSLD